MTSSRLRAPALLLALVACLGALVATPSLAGFGPAQGAAGGAAPTLAQVLAQGATVPQGVDILFADSEGTSVSIDVPSADELRLTAGTCTVTGILTASGGVRSSVELQSVTSGTGAPATLIATTTGARINNTGTTVKAACTLPTAAAGLHYYFDVVDSDGLRVNAASGDNIRLGDTTSATAGYFESVRVGSSVHLVAIDSTTWQADGITGTWRADSTTSAGYAYTPHVFTATMSHTWDADADVSETALYCTHVGDMLTCRGQISFAGAPPNTAWGVTLPNSWVTAGTMGEPSTGNASCPAGLAMVYDFGVGTIAMCPMRVDEPGSTSVNATTSAATSAYFSASAPITWASGDRITFHFTVTVQ